MKLVSNYQLGKLGDRSFLRQINYQTNYQLGKKERSLFFKTDKLPVELPVR
ncbi:MAG: hypothetical protein F6K37_22590 [Moorea sp. SIO4E2]|uniref:hypothetical protein n=1 Tax=Moorena sp. SIO4E2 TaxID=2607826 RepID=UPI0013BAAE40|nr:hypothetical protein [Moorena sp. SIO4E2]NEQ08633.1 hypothetical protein [Moorena sp. SIO4E2]